MVLNHFINWKTFLFDLSNRIAIVTGASQGIGNTIAKVLAHSGAHVICIARTEEKLKDITNQIKDSGGSADYISCDISDGNHFTNSIKTLIAFSNLRKKIYSTPKKKYKPIIQNTETGRW